MLGIFINILVPVFVIVGVGYTVAKTVGAKPQSLATLSYWVLGPVFVFDILSKASLGAGEVVRIVGATALTMAIVGIAAVGAGLLSRAPRSITSATALTSIYGNAGNFGLAISAFALGDDVLPIAGLVMVTINTLGILTGVGLATAGSAPWWKVARTAILTPLALAVLPALAVNVTGIDMPTWIDRPVSLIASALIPVMLLTLGIQLAGMKRAIPRRATAVPLVLKLVAAPLVAFAAVALIGPEGVAGDVVIIQASMPAAVFTSLIALEHELEADFVTTVVLSGTLLSALTIPVVIALL